MADSGTPDATAEPAPKVTEPAAVAWIRRINGAVGHAEAAIVLVFLGALIFVGAYQAIARNFFRHNPDWVDPIIRYSVFLIGLVGGALAAQADRLINMDLTTRILGARVRLGIKVLSGLFSIYVCWYFYKAGMLVYRSMVGERDHNIIKAEHVALAIPVCMMLIAFHMLMHAAVDAYYVASGRTPPKVERPVGHH
jgi:TRAP-type C4-dicarboxylate transport system permease small subunit